MTDLLIDLAAARFGGRVLETSDEHFGKASRLIADGEPQTGGDRVDAWETARRRRSGHEWAIIRLGLPGVMRRITLDTSHITGTHPAEASIEAIDMRGDPTLVDLIRQPERWRDVVARSPISPDHQHDFPVRWAEPATHVRLVAYPDGAVARLRVLGEPITPDNLAGGSDLAAVLSGGLAIDCSDAHFSGPNDMLLDEKTRRASGWLTRRRRDGRSDWAIIRLALPADLQRIVVDTRGFDGNAPEACTIDGAHAPGSSADDLRAATWEPVLGRTALAPDRRHEFSEFLTAGPFTHVRLTIHPDGGVNRFQVFGTADRTG